MPVWLIIALVSCATALSSRADNPQADVPKILADLQRLDNLSLKSGPSVYVGEDLYEYINGSAESFHEYDFARVSSEELTIKSGGETIIVDIYDMTEPINAFGVFSRFRLPQSEYFDIGTECQYLEPILNMCKGRFYVQLAGARPFPGLKEQLVGIAREIDRRIDAKPARPGQLELLPAAGRIPHTELYIRKNALGFAFLKDAWSAKYETNGKQQTLTLVCFDSEKEASEAFRKLRAELGGSVEDKPDSNAECITGIEGGSRRFTAQRKGKQIIYSSDCR